MEAFNADQQIDKILVNKELKGGLVKGITGGTAREKKKIPVTKVPESKLNRITRKNHQGVGGLLFHRLPMLPWTMW